MLDLQSKPWRDIHYRSSDDLKLYARHYPAPDERYRSVVCLAGLTRNSRDFHALATHLSTHPETPRNVYCVDYRGRGQSDFDPNWRNYMPHVELDDVLDFLTIQGLHQVGIVGTSRGGIIAMAMAAARPTVMGPVVLNDVGPVIETRGLARIVNYVRRMPTPKTWADAMQIMREINERGFPDFTDAQWDQMARSVFEERKGRLVLSYDRKLAKAISTIDLSRPFPPLWPEFTAMSKLPAFVIRGELSDVLSTETLNEMVERHPNLRTMTVPDQGHAPTLAGRDQIEAIASFFAVND
jgi:pimeloyl-ACP methyl ester carboxylesterase